MNLLIVGGGNAGLAAAVTAGQLSIPTTVIEKTDRLGGQLHWSSGHFSAGGTRLQRSKGIDDTPDEHRADVERLAHGRGNQDLIELATRLAPNAVDWIESLGFPFSPESPAFVTGHELYGKPRTYWGGTDPRSGGRPILDTLLGALDRVDTVTVKTRTRMVDLIATDGRVAGVVLDDGTEIRADHTILATGGYGASRSLIAELQPAYAEALTGCLPHATGDGLEVLRRYGTRVAGTDTYVPTMGMIPDPDRPGFGIPLHVARLTVDPVQRPPSEIWVDLQGQRFVDEATRSPYERERALMTRPGLTMAAIWDEPTFENTTPVIGPDWTHAGMRREAARGAWLHRCDTLDQLAGRLGIDRLGLAATIREWNAGFDRYGDRQGTSPIDTPPFWGLRCTGGMLLSRGGPTVDRLLRPVLADGSVLDGLHCVGEVLGMGQFSGDNFAGGMSVGPALALGHGIVIALQESVPLDETALR